MYRREEKEEEYEEEEEESLPSHVPLEEENGCLRNKESETALEAIGKLSESSAKAEKL